MKVTRPSNSGRSLRCIAPAKYEATGPHRCFVCCRHNRQYAARPQADCGVRSFRRPRASAMAGIDRKPARPRVLDDYWTTQRGPLICKFDKHFEVSLDRLCFPPEATLLSKSYENPRDSREEPISPSVARLPCRALGFLRFGGHPPSGARPRKGWADSTSQRKNLGELLHWCHESKRFAWTTVQTIGDERQPFGTVEREIRSLRHVLTEQAIGVLVGAALPGAVAARGAS